jgi:hypothetical protein
LAVTALPFQIAATRSRSTSNAAQKPRPRSITSPRGVRLRPAFSPPSRTSTTDEKNGKSFSTQSPQWVVGRNVSRWPADGPFDADPSATSHHTVARAIAPLRNLAGPFGVVL